ncbi:hypothetical protein PC117_g27346, partial [Phytophthora cactorum]
MDDLDARVQEVLENTTAEDQVYLCAFRELETINGESIAVWLSRVPLQSPICLDALSSQDRMRIKTRDAP